MARPRPSEPAGPTDGHVVAWLASSLHAVRGAERGRWSGSPVRVGRPSSLAASACRPLRCSRARVVVGLALIVPRRSQAMLGSLGDMSNAG